MPELETVERVRVFIEDHTGNKRREARIAASAPVRELVPALITALGLPATDPAGRPVTYYLVFGDRQLRGDETLAAAGVADRDTLTLVPEVITDPLVDELIEILEKMNLESLSPYERRLQLELSEKITLDIREQSSYEDRIESLERNLIISSSGQPISKLVLRAIDLTNLDFLEDIIPLERYIPLLRQIGSLYQNRPEFRLFIRLVGLIVAQAQRLQSLERRVAELERRVAELERIVRTQPVRYFLPGEYPVRPGKVVIGLTLRRDIESFGEAAQREWVREIAAATGTPESEIAILRVVPGSVHIILEVPEYAAERILQFCCSEQSASHILPSAQPPAVELEPPPLEMVEQATIVIRCNNQMQVSFEIYRDTGTYFPDDNGDCCLRVEVDGLNQRLSHIGKNIQTYRKNGDQKAHDFWREEVKQIGQDLAAQIFSNPELARCLGELSQRIDPAQQIFRFVGPRWHLGLPYELLFRSYDDKPLIIQHPVCRQVSGRPSSNTQTLGGILRRIMSPTNRSSASRNLDLLRVLLIASSREHQQEVDKEVEALQELIERAAQARKIGVLIQRYCTDEICYQQAGEAFERCSYHIVHYAGDCLFDSQDPEQSGLGFWERPGRNGDWRYLRTRELALRFQNSQTLLFFLSCNVGAMIGNQQSLKNCEYLGVIDALVQAGVPNILGHRWYITPASARCFAEKFYEGLFAMQSPVRAVHYARRKMYILDPTDEIWMSSILVSQQLEQMIRP